mmetsp:Transcript_41626/g.50652  ORF Transcript_41626/g.50652 Transcript_41626/m.50652 type:complete len:106 (+) Transcript_41626:146-463(+)
MSSTTAVSVEDTIDVDCQIFEKVGCFPGQFCARSWSCEMDSLMYDLIGLEDYLRENQNEIHSGKNWIHIPNAVVDKKNYTISVLSVEGVTLSCSKAQSCLDTGGG